MISAITAGIQWVNAAGLLAAFVAAVIMYRRWPDLRGLLIAPGLWAAYGVVFYVLVFSGRLSAEGVLLWGAIHRALAVIMILGGLMALWAIVTHPPGPDDD